ncbi:MAG: hypothetical protein P4N60_11015 [Verrucomicrobiae bacterium]|nr:hypothetical protein [Verrucomicrobiae bacterium]
MNDKKFRAGAKQFHWPAGHLISSKNFIANRRGKGMDVRRRSKVLSIMSEDGF